MIGRVVRRTLRSVVRALILKPALRALAAALLLSLVVLAVVFAVSTPGFQLPGAPGQRSNAAEQFLRGTQTYDANMVWDALSEQVRKNYEGNGGLQALQSQLNESRDHGVRVEQISHIGGRDLPDGTSMQFYLIARTAPQYSGRVAFIPYVFTLDQSGKISGVQ